MSGRSAFGARLCGVLLALAFFMPLHAQEWQGVERIVAVGDIHGDYDNYIAVLREAGIVNRRGNWDAGETHFVQVGDLPDRGPDTDKIIEHMQRLERQAGRDGGAVHALIGNHEAMNMIGDLRYVHPGEYEALRGRRSRRLRDTFYDNHVASLQQADPDFVADAAYREQFDLRYPLGFIEHRLAWDREGEFGAWVLEHNTVIKINRTLFLHGGISPAVLGMSLNEINEQIRFELGGGLGAEPGLSETENSPLWYRGLVNNDEQTELAHLEAILEFYDVDRLVLGHTPGLGTIRPRFGARVLIIDTGISSHYGAHLASLLIEDDSLYTLQGGERIAIPTDQAALLPYLQQIAELEPGASALRVYIEALQSPTPQLLPAILQGEEEPPN